MTATYTTIKRAAARIPSLAWGVILAAVICVAATTVYHTQNPRTSYGQARFAIVTDGPLVGEASRGDYLILSHYRRSLGFIEWATGHRTAPEAYAAAEYDFGELMAEDPLASELGAERDTLRSQDNAYVAATRIAAVDVVELPLLVVDSVVGPAAEAGLTAGDRILTVNGSNATHAVLDAAIAEGASVALDVARDGDVVTFVVQPVPTSGRTNRPYSIGVRATLGARLADERPAITTPANTRGPSGGLMYALTYADALTEGDLTGGMTVAGTGTIAPGGTVGRVGGVPSKVRAAVASGADVVFVPESQVDEAVEASQGEVTVVGVRTLAGAMRWLCESGGESTACANVFFDRAPSGVTSSSTTRITGPQ